MEKRKTKTAAPQNIFICETTLNRQLDGLPSRLAIRLCMFRDCGSLTLRNRPLPNLARKEEHTNHKKGGRITHEISYKVHTFPLSLEHSGIAACSMRRHLSVFDIRLRANRRDIPRDLDTLRSPTQRALLLPDSTNPEPYGLLPVCHRPPHWAETRNWRLTCCSGSQTLPS